MKGRRQEASPKPLAKKSYRPRRSAAASSSSSSRTSAPEVPAPTPEEVGTLLGLATESELPELIEIGPSASSSSSSTTSSSRSSRSSATSRTSTTSNKRKRQSSSSSYSLNAAHTSSTYSSNASQPSTATTTTIAIANATTSATTATTATAAAAPATTMALVRVQRRPEEILKDLEKEANILAEMHHKITGQLRLLLVEELVLKNQAAAQQHQGLLLGIPSASSSSGAPSESTSAATSHPFLGHLSHDEAKEQGRGGEEERNVSSGVGVVGDGVGGSNSTMQLEERDTGEDHDSFYPTTNESEDEVF